MRRVNVRELHRRTGAVVDEVAKGDVVVIEKRGVAVAELRPVGPAAPGFPPEHWEFLKRFPKLKGDSGKFISEDRDRG
jgi:antitoxin (DNA-binding transcriptional repressor) of toxin-antitoxin stability system